MISFAAKAQYPSQQTPTQFSTGWFKQGWNQSDSGHILAVRSPNFTPRFAGTTIMYRNPSGDTTIQYWTGNRWIGISSSGTITASNGLNMVGGDVRLGGALSGFTNITDVGNQLLFSGTADKIFRTTNGVSQYSATTSPTSASLFGNNSSTLLFSEINAIDSASILIGGKNGLFYNKLAVEPNKIIMTVRSNTTPYSFILNANGQLQATGMSSFPTIDTSYKALVMDGSGNIYLRAGTNSGGGSGLTSVGLSMPSAFTVTNSPLTSNGSIAVSGAGTTAQYMRGNGTLGTTDTGMIPNFHLKVRSLISGSSPITFNQTSGIIGINNANTSGAKGAASFTGAFSDNGSGQIDLLTLGSAGSCTGCNLNIDAKGRITAYSDGAGGATNNVNIGAGFRPVNAITQEMRTYFAGFGTRIDSVTNANGLTWASDTTRGSGLPTYWYVDSAIAAGGGGSGTVTNVSGTTNRITVTNPTTTPVIDIAATYVGQASITTLGTVTTGVWNGTTIGATFGGTGQTTVTTGDLLYGSAANTWSKLADVATGNALISGGIGVAPSYGKIGLTTHVSGILPIANGGTGTATPSLVAGTDISITGTWPNQTINATGGSAPSLTATQVAFGSVGNTITSEAAFNYVAATNYLTVDTTKSKKNITDTVKYLPSVLVPNGNRIAGFIDSYTVGQSASPMTDSGYIYRMSRFYNLPVDNYAITGAGSIQAIYQHNVNVNYPSQYVSVVMSGLNTLRYGGGTAKNYQKIMQSYKAIFCNNFSKTFYPASNSTVVTRYGSWTTNWSSSSGGGKAGNSGAFTQTLNDSIKFVFNDSTVWFSVIAGDGSGSIYTSPTIEVYIDGVLIESYSLNNQTDGIADGPFDGKLTPVVRYYTGLSYGSHTIKVVNKNSNYLLFDGFGTLVDRNSANTYIMFHIPLMTAAGYLEVPANSSTPITNTMNGKLDSLYATFPSWYPVKLVQTNSYYLPNSGDIGVDNVHPNNQGHRHIFDGAVAAIGSGSVNVASGSTFYSNGGLYLKNDTAVVKVAVGDVVYNQGQFILNDTMRIGAFNDKPVAIVSNGATIASFHKGTNYVELLGNTRSFGNLQASGGSIVLDGSGFAPQVGAIWKMGAYGALPGILGNCSYTAVANSRYWLEYMIQNQKRYSLIDDAGSTFNDWLVVSRNGVHADSINFPMGKLFLGEMTRLASADSVLTWDVATKQIRLAPNGAGGVTTIYNGNGTLSGNRTVTGSNNSLTFDGIFNFRINANSLLQSKTGGGAIYSTSVIGASNSQNYGYTPVAATYSKGVAIIIDTNNNVGFGTSAPTTMPLYSTGTNAVANNLMVGGSQFDGITTISANTTIDLTKYYVRIDATSGNITVTLPAASTAFGASLGIHYVFKRLDNTGNTVTIQRAGSDTIDGGTSITLTTQYQVKELLCSSTSTWDVR